MCVCVNLCTFVCVHARALAFASVRACAHIDYFACMCQHIETAKMMCLFPFLHSPFLSPPVKPPRFHHFCLPSPWTLDKWRKPTHTCSVRSKGRQNQRKHCSDHRHHWYACQTAHHALHHRQCYWASSDEKFSWSAATRDLCEQQTHQQHQAYSQRAQRASGLNESVRLRRAITNLF